MSPTAKLVEVMSRTVEVAMADQRLADLDALFATQSRLPVLPINLCIGAISNKDKAKASNGLDSSVAEVIRVFWQLGKDMWFSSRLKHEIPWQCHVISLFQSFCHSS